MKRKILAVVTATVVAFWGAVGASVSAQAGPINVVACTFEVERAGSQSLTRSGNCAKAQPRITYRSAGGSAYGTNGTLRAGTSYSPSITSPLTITGYLGRAHTGSNYSAWASA